MSAARNHFHPIVVVTNRVTPVRTANRFAVAVHILSLVEGAEPGQATSERMAGSIGVNAVVVRNVSGQLRRAGLLETHQGVPGARLTRGSDAITLRDVYRAVEADEEIFGIHPRPNPRCPVGAHIQDTLESVFGEAQRALSDRLAATTVAEVTQDLARRAAL